MAKKYIEFGMTFTEGIEIYQGLDLLIKKIEENAKEIDDSIYDMVAKERIHKIQDIQKRLNLASIKEEDLREEDFQ